jgi:hypothetical protein
MLNAIGAIPTTTPASGKSTASLAAQLSRCETQLSDWVNCPSGRTPAGKAKIAEITGKISDIQQRLKAQDGDGSAGATTGAASMPRSPTTSSGTRIDVYA